MNLSGLLPFIRHAIETSQPELASLLAADAEQQRVHFTVRDAAKAAVVAALARYIRAPVLLLTARPDSARSLADQLAAWLGDSASVHLFAEREPLPYERLLPDISAVGERLRALRALSDSEGSATPPLVVASVRALAQRTLTPAELATATVTIRAGQRLRPNIFLSLLSRQGYRMRPTADVPGTAAHRGGIIDVFPPGAALPVRIDMLGDHVDSLRLYDPVTQRSRQPVDEAVILPAYEMLLPSERAVQLSRDVDPSNLPESVRDDYREELVLLAEGHIFEGDHFYVPFLAEGSLLDHLPLSALLVCDEPPEMAEALNDLNEQAEALRDELIERRELPRGLPLPHIPTDDLLAALDRVPRRLDLLRWAETDEVSERSPAIAPAVAYGGRLRQFASEVGDLLRRGSRVIIVSQQDARVREALSDEGLAPIITTSIEEPPPAGSLLVVRGFLAQGFTLRQAPGRTLWQAPDRPPRPDSTQTTGSHESGMLNLLTDAEVFGMGMAKIVRRPASASSSRSPGLSLRQLSVGDYVVHVEHGIARFAGLVRRDVDGHQRDYLELHYADGDKLLVPVEQMDRVGPYVGPGDQEPSITRLNTGEWARTKARIRRAVNILARDLVELYAAREVLEGYAFSPDTPWQQEMEATFPYVETPDQIRAIAEVKADMESPHPMDRLVCGDVGYGKTEVAIRAAFKAVMDGMQVAVLVPTTVLAQQHYQTFTERLASYAMRIEVLSRFRSPQEQKQVVEALRDGQVDIVIGTHRLLQKDVRFKKLGLAIIDEEQRFGVAHKEQFKKLRREVDVLTLSATPIPRTLYMSLTGIRDISTMETPPEDRLPIKTYVAQRDPRLIREAIVRELQRGGQVYFVHNRVQTIGRVYEELADLLPEARIAIGHGQMPEEVLERVMADFAEGRTDVLLCTTIIESGLDIPKVNTIIIDRADKLGLAQLYQLRGRVGRSAQRAYAYLLYDRRSRLTDAGRRRLQAMFEASELGAGFQIAMRDLEIRGAGNLLGAEQSGHIAAVGFDLYSRLLAEAVERLRALQRGEKVAARTGASEPPPVTINLPLTAHIPEGYIGDLTLRLSIYQRLGEATSLDAIADAQQELRDRFGPPPPAVENLLYILRLRALALQANVRSIDSINGEIVVRVNEGPKAARPRLPEPVPQGVQVRSNQVRLDMGRLGRAWRDMLVSVLEGLAISHHA